MTDPILEEMARVKGVPIRATPEAAATWQPTPLLDDGERERATTHDSWAREYRSYARSLTDAPPEFHEAAAYVALSVAVGRRAQFRLSFSDVIPTLWVACVADSTSKRKTVSMGIQRRILADAGFDGFVPDDATPARLLTWLGERTPGAPVLYARDEWAGPYAQMNAAEYLSGLKQVQIALHDGRDYEKQLQGVVTKGKQGQAEGPKRKAEVVRIIAPFLSQFVATQRELFETYAQPGDIGSGFLARFAVVMPEDRTEWQPLRERTREDDNTHARIVAALRRIMQIPACNITLAPYVLDRHNAYASALDGQMVEAPFASIAGPVFARSAERALKVAILLGFAEGGRVELDHLLAAIEVCERWRIAAYRLFSALGPSAEEKRLLRAVEYLRGGSRTRGQVSAHLRATAKDMALLAATLHERGWLVVTPVERGGGGEVWNLAPELTPDLQQALKHQGRNGTHKAEHLQHLASWGVLHREEKQVVLKEGNITLDKHASSASGPTGEITATGPSIDAVDPPASRHAVEVLPPGIAGVECLVHEFSDVERDPDSGRWACTICGGPAFPAAKRAGGGSVLSVDPLEDEPIR